MVPAAEGKPTIANYLSLYTTAALAVWITLHVCACVCVIVGEIGKLLVTYFSILKEKGRNVKEEEVKGGKGGGKKGEFEEAWQKYADRI